MMDIRIVLLCAAAVCSQSTQKPYYHTEFAQPDLQGHGTTNSNPGFVQPVDFAAVTQQFIGHSSLPAPFAFGGSDVFGAESKGSFKNLAPFQGSLFGEESKKAGTGFVDPFRFTSPFGGSAPEVIYRPQTFSTTEQPQPQHEYKDTSRDGPSEGKSSYPVPESSQRSEQSLYASPAEVEVFYPKEKAILPQINGRPKPYDGYRAATEDELHSYGHHGPSPPRDVIGRYTEGAPQVFHAARPSNIRIKRSDEYDHKQKRRLPKKHVSPLAEKKEKYTQRKHTYPKTSRPDDSQSHATEESEATEEAEEVEEAEDAEDTEEPAGYTDKDARKEAEDFSKKFEKYRYENNFDIPQLKVKNYPFEKLVRGKKQAKRESAEEEEDEFTSGYLNFKESLPSDLETFYGGSEIEEKYSVAATENLEKNENCAKVDKIATEEELKAGKVKRNADNEQVCYICTDPKTGGSFEQCAYQTEPQSKKYFFGGSTSFSSKEQPKTGSYRYKRSLGSIDPFNYEYYFYDEPNGKRVVRQEPEYELKTFHPKKGKAKSVKNNKRKGKKPKKTNKDAYVASTHEVEQPPESYDGPAFTYEGPSQSYEGPAHTYEGPAESYEGPSEEYHDESIEDYQYVPPKALRQSSSPSKTRYHSAAKPVKTNRYPSKPRHYSSGPKSEVEEFKDGDTGYAASYRFGPEHFEGEASTASNEKEETKSPSGNVKVYKNGDVCEKKKKDNMVCMVCKNAKTGGTYEQCQYSSKPKDKYYSFGKAKSYKSGAKSNPERYQREAQVDQAPDKSDVVEKKVLITQTKVFGASPDELEAAESRNYNRLHEFLKTGDLVGSYSHNSEEREPAEEESNAETEDNSRNTDTVEEIEPRDGVPGLEDFLYGGPDSEKEGQESQDNEGYKSYDDYFRHLFPEYAKAESGEQKQGFDPFENLRQFREEQPELEHTYAGAPAEAEEGETEESGAETQDTKVQPQRLKDQPSRIPKEFYYDDQEHKKNLEKALGEFQQKDWSKCKKIEKNKLTCYQCVDQHGVNNEECMYVEESQPVSKHLAYHEKKKFDPEAPHKAEQSAPANQQALAPNNTQDEMIGPVPETDNVREVPHESVKRENYVKGDMEGVERVVIETIATTTTAETPTDISTPKMKVKKGKKQRMRQKTVEGVTESETEKPRKRRKYPVKKFLGDSADLPRATAEPRADESVVQVFLNSTQTPAP